MRSVGSSEMVFGEETDRPDFFGMVPSEATDGNGESLETDSGAEDPSTGRTTQHQARRPEWRGARCRCCREEHCGTEGEVLELL